MNTKLMRSARNHHPEWGYFAPMPSILYKVLITTVAAAVAASSGVSVVVSLVDQLPSDARDSAVAAPAVVTSVHAGTREAASSLLNMSREAQPPLPVSESVPVPIQEQPQANAPVPVQPVAANRLGGPADGVATRDLSRPSIPQGGVGVAAPPKAPPTLNVSLAHAPNGMPASPGIDPTPNDATKRQSALGRDSAHQANGAERTKKWTRTDSGFGPLLLRFFRGRS